MKSVHSQSEMKSPGASLVGRRRRTEFVAIVVACATGAVAALTSLPAAANDAGVEGVWHVTRHGVNCQTGQQLSTFPAIMSFNRGGMVAGFGVPPGGSPANGSPEYGTWKREPGAANYSFRLLSFNYDTGGIFAGSTEITARLAMSQPGDGFTYTATVAFFDATGYPLFKVCGAATAVRFE